MMRRLLPFLLGLLSTLPAWGETLFVSGAGAGLRDGTSLANAWQNSVTWGTGAGQVGRGDTLAVCGTRESPVTATLTPSGIGAFDGTANSDGDVIRVTGEAALCGGTEGVIKTANGAGINASGVAAIYMHDMTCTGTGSGGSCFNQLLSASSGCVNTAGYWCGLQYNLTCESASAHCASIASSANTNFPPSSVTGVWQHDITSRGAGGAACRVALNTDGAVQDRCKSYGDSQTINTWSVYQRGITLNCGAANSGAGVTWTQVSGTLYKTTQASCGASISTVIDVYAANPATGVPGRLVPDAGCTTNEANCISAVGSGEWGRLADVLYINVGKQPSATAAVYLTYAWNTNARMSDHIANDPGSAFDGVGAGCDFGTDGCVIERIYSERAPGYAATCGGGAKNCWLRSSISKDSRGPGGFRINSGNTADGLSVSGNDVGVVSYSLSGETNTVSNVAVAGGDAVLEEKAEGTLVENATSTDPQFSGGDNPATSAGFRPRPTSPLCGAGVYTGKRFDKTGRKFRTPPSIGAYQCGAGRSPALR